MRWALIAYDDHLSVEMAIEASKTAEGVTMGGGGGKPSLARLDVSASSLDRYGKCMAELMAGRPPAEGLDQTVLAGKEVRRILLGSLCPCPWGGGG